MNNIFRGLAAPHKGIALIIAMISATLLVSGCNMDSDDDKSSSEITMSYDELMTILAKQCVILENQLTQSSDLNGDTITVTPDMYDEIDISDFDYNRISFEGGEVYYQASDGYTYCITPTTEEDVLYEE